VAAEDISSESPPADEDALLPQHAVAQPAVVRPAKQPPALSAEVNDASSSPALRNVRGEPLIASSPAFKYMRGAESGEASSVEENATTVNASQPQKKKQQAAVRSAGGAKPKPKAKTG
jgi:hypothetical protein